MSDLPEKWTTALIGDIIEFSPKNNVPDNTEAGFVPLHLMGKRFLDKHGFEKKRWSEIKKGYTHFADGDVLLARITPSFENGKGGLVEGLPNGIGAGSTEYFVCRPIKELLHPKYLLAFFKTTKFLKNGAKVMQGAVGQQRVPKQYVLEHEIPLAPLDEQKRIAEKLDSLLTRVDSCERHLERVPQILKRFRQSVLAAATSGRLTEDWREENAVNGEWEESTFGESGSVSGGLTKNQKRNLIEWRKPYLRVANVYANKLELEDVAEIGLTETEFEKTKLLKDDLLIVEGNGSLEQIGRAAIWNNEIADCVHQNHIIRWRTNGNALPKFALFWLLSPEGRSFMVSVASSTSGLNTLSISKVSSIPIRLPSLEEQAEIVRRVESLFAYAERLEARYLSASERVARLTPSLLAKGFRGELVEQDSNDEPAEKLLERVRGR